MESDTNKVPSRRALSAEEQEWSVSLNRLWQCRNDKSITQEMASERLGYASQATISQYINGVIPLNTDAILGFASLLEVQPGQINPALSHVALNSVRAPLPNPSDIPLDIEKAFELVMERINIARVNNLKALVGEGTAAAFCDQWDLDAAYISQITTGHRSFGERAARRIEIAMGLQPGVLDTSSDTDIGGAVRPDSPVINRHEKALLETYRTLSHKKQRMALRILACIE